LTEYAEAGPGRIYTPGTVVSTWNAGGFEPLPSPTSSMSFSPAQQPPHSTPCSKTGRRQLGRSACFYSDPARLVLTNARGTLIYSAAKPSLPATASVSPLAALETYVARLRKWVLPATWPPAPRICRPPFDFSAHRWLPQLADRVC
jgi:hypothetical protein